MPHIMPGDPPPLDSRRLPLLHRRVVRRLLHGVIHFLPRGLGEQVLLSEVGESAHPHPQQPHTPVESTPSSNRRAASRTTAGSSVGPRKVSDRVNVEKS